MLGRSVICRRLLLCVVTPPGVEPELLLDDLAPPGVEPVCLLYRFVVGGVPAFSGERAPKSKKAATWRRRGGRGLSNGANRNSLARTVAELEPIDYRDQQFAAKVVCPLQLDGPLVGAGSGRR